MEAEFTELFWLWHAAARVTGPFVPDADENRQSASSGPRLRLERPLPRVCRVERVGFQTS